MDAFGIIAALRRKCYTQSSLAALLDVPVGTVNAVIHNRTKSRRTAVAISQIVGEPVEALWPGRYDYKPYTRSRRPLPPLAD